MSSPTGDHTINFANGDVSDSDLSDVQAADVDGASPDPDADANGSPTEKHEMEYENASDSENDNSSDDGDFDAAESPASPRSNGEDVRASSPESRPAPKRKAAHVIEDEFMRENPELYGLRRSVWTYPSLLSNHADRFKVSTPTAS